MRALTLWPEWSWAMVHLDKTIENRDWAPPPAFIGEPFAIHAGRNVGGKATKKARADGLEGLARTAAFAGWRISCDIQVDNDVRMFVHRDELPSLESYIVRSAVVAVAKAVRVIDVEADLEDPLAINEWLVGRFGWVLDLHPLPDPVPVRRGAQGLWYLSTPDARAVVEQLPDLLSYADVGPSVVNRYHYKPKSKSATVPDLPQPWVYIGRGTPLGNPFTVEDHGNAALDLYRAWLWCQIKRGVPSVLDALDSITADHHLVCSCKPRPCHGDVVVSAWRWWINNQRRTEGMKERQ